MKAMYSDRRQKLNPLFEVMKTFGDKYGLTIAQIATAYVINKGVTAVCGCRKPYQVEQLKTACDV